MLKVARKRFLKKKMKKCENDIDALKEKAESLKEKAIEAVVNAIVN